MKCVHFTFMEFASSSLGFSPSKIFLTKDTPQHEILFHTTPDPRTLSQNNFFLDKRIAFKNVTKLIVIKSLHKTMNNSENRTVSVLDM